MLKRIRNKNKKINEKFNDEKKIIKKIFKSIVKNETIFKREMFSRKG